MGKRRNRTGVGGPTHKYLQKTKAKSIQIASSPEATAEPDSKDLFEIYRGRYEELISADQAAADHAQSTEDIDHVNATKVPLVYRAQIECRSQLQRIVRNGDLDSENYVLEWIGKVHQTQPTAMARVPATTPPYRTSNPFHANGISRTLEISIAWRLLSNSGLIPDLICPVIGPGGWPWIPGSSIKGLFRRSCTQDQAQKWCGAGDETSEIKQGCLRFHGAWPKDLSWRDGLLDLTHPQQAWQVGWENGRESHTANPVISLLRPTLLVGLSAQGQMEEEEWTEITQVLQQALGKGLGGRTAAGYGFIAGKVPSLDADLLLSANLRGQGPASKNLRGQGAAAKLLDRSPELRPTMFRAAIRGMALRLFAGIVDEQTAQSEVERLFGGFQSKDTPTVGMLACRFTHTAQPEFGLFGIGPNEQDVFVCQGDLDWHLAGRVSINNKGRELLIDLLHHLHALVMVLSGFGRSWRRPDHRIFLPSYKTRPIGCHWEWSNPETLPSGFIPEDAAQLAALIEAAGKRAVDWLTLHRQPKRQPAHQIWNSELAHWREVIHPRKMVVWCRKVESKDSATAITWIHQPKPNEQRNSALDISKSRIKGGFFWIEGKERAVVSRLWIKMFPLQQAAISQKPMDSPHAHGDALRILSDVQLAKIWPGPFLEIVTLFPDPQRLPDQEQFIACMDAGGGSDPPFQRAWGAL